MTIQLGDPVTLHFELTTADGRIVESTWQREMPVTITLGDGHLPESFEQCLLGLHVGAKEQWQLAPEQAFGERSPEQIVYLERSEFPADIELEEGLVMGFTQLNGEEIPGIIQSINGDSVTVDLNHPLAGETILFRVEILSSDKPGTCQEV
ncbi:FKBP-type peptidyl-prolyl cis-trans isomerase [Celerinatantimonas sp. YJH-8]|uniref:FKBP-type peptidyl-prolyl cis-trans isomerase n=1 Tax=Celerinatantimonas sp. YJH-8 TaxID=3228714 RepID=UPI0038BF6969